MEVVATLVALFEREKRGGSGEEKEMGAGDMVREAEESKQILSCERGMNGKM